MFKIFKKTAICLAVLTTMIFSSITSVFALDKNKVYTEFEFCTARVYLCDDRASTIILKNVKPLNQTDGTGLCNEVEYSEMRLTKKSLYNVLGERLLASQVNTYLLDGEAIVLIGKNNFGISVLFVKFKQK